MNGTSMLNIGGWVLLVIIVLQVQMTFRAYSGIPLRAIGRMIAISFKGRKIVLLCGGAVLFVNSLWPDLMASWIPPEPTRILGLGMSMIALSGASLPPAVLFLGISQEPSLSFVAGLRHNVFPLKIAHLLQPGATMESMLMNEVAAEAYRVRDNWQSAVRSLSEVAPLIIFDGRTPSPHLSEEIDHIAESNTGDRTFIITDAHGDVKVRQAKQFPTQAAPCYITAPHLSAGLSGIGWRFLFSAQANLPAFLEDKLKRLTYGW